MSSHELPTDAEFEQAMGALREWLLPHEPVLSKTLHLSRRSFFDEKGISRLFSFIISYQLRYGTTVPQVERLRDALILPLSKYCTGPDLGAFFTTVGVLIDSRGGQYTAVFATSEAVDVFLRLVAKPAQLNEMNAVPFFKVFAELSNDPECAAAIRTPAVRDAVFVGCAQYATISDARQLMILALWNLTESDEGRRLFATTAVRDKVIVPSAPIIATRDCAARLLGVVGQISGAYDGCGFELFHNFAMRDIVFMPLAKFMTARTIYGFYCSLIRVTATVDRRGSDLFSTKAVRDRLFVGLSKHVETSDAATMCFEAMFTIVRDSGSAEKTKLRRRDLFAVKTVRDNVLIPLVRLQPAPNALFSLVMMFTAAAPALFKTAVARDGILLPMVPSIVAERSSMMSVSITVELMSSKNGRALLGTPRARDELIIPLLHAAPDASCALILMRVLSHLSVADPDSNSCEIEFATPGVRDGVVHFARLLDDTPDVSDVAGLLDDPSVAGCAAFFFRVLSRLVSLNPTYSICFATCAVRDEIFVRLYDLVTAAVGGAAAFFNALQAFADAPLQADTHEGVANHHPLLGSDPSLSFRQQVLVLLADKATSGRTAALLVSELLAVP